MCDCIDSMVRKAKRSRGFERDDAPDAEDCHIMLAKLPHDKITDMLKELLEQSDCPELRWAIKNARDKQQGKPMDANSSPPEQARLSPP